ncbi:hypothetical protein O181_050891 [Austropuccinia psidii MF-1]|uniref:Uncharacterized protein n=1 Tax=Austropuccinia psidii MF-1 TaxID=1389203 RepID=A0A9Q3E2N9_9BASI|nr:hypothetical protein [Austropuccinia psidii MF-1]
MAEAIQPGAKLGPIGHVISFMANWLPWVFNGIHTITPSNGHFMASGHILPSLAFLADSHFTNPQAFIFKFWAWGVILSSRSLQAPWPSSLVSVPPLSLLGFWPFWAIWAPYGSYGPRSADPILAMDNHGSIVKPWPLAATRSSQPVFPLNSRGFLPSLHTIHTQRCRHGAYMVLYTIMHHFCSAIQWSSFHDPISPSQLKVSNPNTHFEGGLISSSV